MKEIGIPTGEFPFPLVEGPKEPRYLTWIRNHSNYLAERGFLDYMRLVAVLVRGIVVNFLTLIPALLVAALLLSVVHAPLLNDWSYAGEGYLPTGDAESPGFVKWLQDHLGTSPPYVLTPWAAVAVVVWFLLFPMVARIFKAVTFKRTLETGSDSSVKLRDKYERTFGAALIALAVVALVETLPVVVHFFHQLRDEGFRGTMATMAGATSVVALSSAGKLLSFFSERKKTLIMVLLALVGMLLPLIVILYVEEHLVYESDLQLDWHALVVVPGALAVGIVVAVGLGTLQGGLREQGWLLGLLGLVVASAAVIFFAKDLFPDQKWFFVLAIAFEIWLFNWLAIDVNLTSVNGAYRDRLAAAFLVGEDVRGDVDIEEDIDLNEICQYENGSTAPYHLINVALNLQGSKDVGIRDRRSDFFVFSKKFIGGRRTGYCRSETLEGIFPQMDLATAMAISAAAASPNMGRGTHPALVATLTLFNVRLGYWVPHPGRLEAARGEARKPRGYSFPEVFREELEEIRQRWGRAYPEGEPRSLADAEEPTVDHGLVGLAFSGGGIRSATLNLGIVQALESRGVFDHVDYMSTVSGGGYLGSSLSTLMRKKTRIRDESSGRRGSLRERFAWRVRPGALMLEMASRLDEDHRWVNLSDGGHIENMAAIELLRRRCKFIMIGDGEADPDLTFNGLATLIRYARIDLGIHVEIDVDELRLGEDRTSREHVALGSVKYPGDDEPGYLLYFKSSFTGDEDEVVQEYRSKNPAFPHESTADQFFSEGQFEAYRDLGQHIGGGVLRHAEAGRMSYAELVAWFEVLAAELPGSPWKK